MKVRFVKVDPTQNMTILVRSEVPRARQPEVAGALMAYNSVHAEQAGFIEPPVNPTAWGRLQMAGGEFCGNATMSLAALVAGERGMRPGDRGVVPLEVSGMQGVLECGVELFESHTRATVAMPPPLRIEERELTAGGRTKRVAAVYFSGITHLIVPVSGEAADWELFAMQAVQTPPEWIGDDAMGVMLYWESEDRIVPLVSVRSAGTTVWERGCGSGTAALGCWLAYRAGAPTQAEIAQPGGVIRVSAQWEADQVQAVSITGDVRIAAEGTAYIAL